MAESQASELEVKREANGKKGAFFIDQGGARVAELTFSGTPDGALYILDHTEVGESLRGRGIARLLVEAAVAWARKEHVKLLPLCPFAKAVFDHEPQLRDVL